MKFCHVGQAGLELLTSGYPPALASQTAGITSVRHHAWPLGQTRFKEHSAVIWRTHHKRQERIQAIGTHGWGAALLGLECILQGEEKWTAQDIFWRLNHQAMVMVLNSRPQVIHLPWPPKCLNYRREPPRPVMGWMWKKERN